MHYETLRTHAPPMLYTKQQSPKRVGLRLSNETRCINFTSGTSWACMRRCGTWQSGVRVWRPGMRTGLKTWPIIKQRITWGITETQEMACAKECIFARLQSACSLFLEANNVSAALLYLNKWSQVNSGKEQICLKRTHDLYNIQQLHET